MTEPRSEAFVLAATLADLADEIPGANVSHVMALPDTSVVTFHITRPEGEHFATYAVTVVKIAVRP